MSTLIIQVDYNALEKIADSCLDYSASVEQLILARPYFKNPYSPTPFPRLQGKGVNNPSPFTGEGQKVEF